MQTLEIKLSEVVGKFFELCAKTKPWEVFEDQALIQTESGFHKFIALENPQSNSFMNALKRPVELVKDGTSYRQVRYSFIALVVHDCAPADFLLLLEKNLTLESSVALYDIKGKRSCCFNKTRSEVFQEFQKYLDEKYHLKLRDLTFSVSNENQFPISNSDYPYSKQAQIQLPEPKRVLLNHPEAVYPGKEKEQNVFYRNDPLPNSTLYGGIATFSSRIRNAIT